MTTDNVRQSAKPNSWQIGKLTLASCIVGICLLGFCTGALLVGQVRLGLDTAGIQTLATITLVFAGEATLYSLRERQHLWSSRPGTWVIVASIGDILIISTLAIRGIAMRPLPVAVVASTLVSAVLFAFLVDLGQVPVFRRLHIA